MKIREMLIPVLLLSHFLLFSVPEGTATEIRGSHGEVAVADSQSHRSHAESTSQDLADTRSYSLFMHHATGYFVLVLGILFAVDRSTRSRYRPLRYAIAAMWMLFGLFIFVRADPDGWPMGSGFGESWAMPTRFEWLQHKLLALIPLGLAVYAFRRPAMIYGKWGSYVTVGLAVIGAAGLLTHQHPDHPGQDVVNIQHHFFAGTSLLVAFSLLQEARGRWVRNRKRLIFPALLILISLQLVWYIE